MKHQPVIAWGLLLAALPALAEIQVAAPASDLDNYRSDTVSLQTDVQTLSVQLGGTGKPQPTCVPEGTRMLGLGRVTVVPAEGKDPEERALFKVVDAAQATTDCATPARLGQLVALQASALSTTKKRSGYSYGTLTVPYKYQLKGDRSLGGGATLGGYVGRRTETFGLSNQLVAFAGVTKVDVPVTDNGKSRTDQLFGLSYGVGLLSTVKGAFQLGLVVGADRVSKSANYANNGKPWVSLSLGFDFTN
jgi:hypothetical protein